ncbi:MAG: hypothetical protein GX316_05160 [Firmicutes bacterium]|nr:hypothetical protein [Bacillota bacterium]
MKVRVISIAETLEEGQKVTAVALKYPEQIAAGSVSGEMFSVPGRSITRCYVNDSGGKGDVQNRGSYVMLELAVDPVPGSPVGSTLLYANQSNHRLPICLSVVQKRNISALGGMQLPAGSFVNTEECNLEVDGIFGAHTYQNMHHGTTLDYRLFEPKDRQEALPLVVFLHGAGERGDNNITQLLANRSALEWATPAAQAAHPCYVLAPQCPLDTSWAVNVGTKEEPVYEASYALKNVLNVIHELIELHNIDTSRIYGTGLSMGSMGTFMLAMDEPTLYAALLTVCGARTYQDKQVKKLLNKPIWGFIAADDMPPLVEGMRRTFKQLEELGSVAAKQVGDEAWNGFLRGEKADTAAIRQLAKAEALGADILYTEYIPGTILPNGHLSWMQVYSTNAVREWVFSQKNKAPYRPAK